MKVFAIVGMPASGKNIARVYAESRGFSYYATGDIVRAEVMTRNLEADAQTTAMISDELRGADGMGVTRRALDAVLASGSAVGFLEGMRSWPEIELIREKADCPVIAFIAPRSLRRERIVARGRPDDSPRSFDDRDRREIDYGTAVPIALADEYVLNTRTLDLAMAELDAIVKKHVPGLR